MAEVNNKKNRRLRLCSKSREGYRNDVPWLSTEGRWLERAGFRIGDYVAIEVHNNKLIIKNLGRDGAR